MNEFITKQILEADDIYHDLLQYFLFKKGLEYTNLIYFENFEGVASYIKENKRFINPQFIKFTGKIYLDVRPHATPRLEICKFCQSDFICYGNKIKFCSSNCANNFKKDCELKYRLANKEKISEYQKNWRQKNVNRLKKISSGIPDAKLNRTGETGSD